MAVANVVLEACVDTVLNSMYAQAHGADRLELCDNLQLEGTTPSHELIRDVIRAVHIPVKVMIRPRAGDFVYTDAEFQEMLRTIRECKLLGVSQIATGILHTEGTLDIERLRILTQEAHPMTITIHKCIDLVPDITEGINALKKIPGVTSILSSGQAATAMDGKSTLHHMLEICGYDLKLIVAGKVTEQNLHVLIDEIGATEYHGRLIV
jgi:copper homeostasis protein